ncbi:MAG TPA: hypothetical protein VGL39_00860, partial [Jatrophihabitantaceae bacterium]
MTSRLFAVSSSVLLLVAASSSVAGGQPSHGDAWRCGSGARSLSHLGDHVYPEAGNGGYTSLHTDVHLAYDAPSNRFLPGNHVVLTDSATQCLSDFSLDFERHSAANPVDGPDLTVQSITVNGRPASFRFVEPTYPGDPNGQDDPDPRAHQASQVTPVGGPNHNPLPPACTPEVTGDDVNAQNGDPCPANKLVITPRRPLRAGEIFRVTVNYTGRPGVHTDGDGSTEGWFVGADGSFVTTEPVGTMDWMPLNNHPSVKPTYDFYDTVTRGRTAIANGRLISGPTDNAPDANFAGGSTSWHWKSPEPIANYLVENSVGNFDYSFRTGANDVVYFEAQDSGITDARKALNKVAMDQQEAITHFEEQFSGPFPFNSDGIVVAKPTASFEEEMQTKIVFVGGRIAADTFSHENMHQWW